MAVPCGLGNAHPSGEFNLGGLGGLAERGQALGVGGVGLGHVRADLGDLGGDAGPPGQLADAVVAADELNLFLRQSFPVAPGESVGCLDG